LFKIPLSGNLAKRDLAMPYFVYVLKSSKDQRYYIGSTSNVAARVGFHNAGRQRSTKHRTPFALVYSEQLNTKEEALAREKQIKRYKGGVAFQRLLDGM
jgi:putative endonuclease